MAGRLNIKQLYRKVHFVAGIFMFVFALLYIFSGMVISKGNWFNHDGEQKTKVFYPLNYQPDTTKMKDFGNEIKQQFDISGRMNFKRNWKNQLIFDFYRPMVRNVVTVYPGLDSLSVVCTKKITFHEANKRIHRMHGCQGEFVYVIWGVLLDLTAISMIVFAISGFLIWFHRRKHMIYGWFIFVPTVILVLIMYLFLK